MELIITCHHCSIILPKDKGQPCDGCGWYICDVCATEEAPRQGCKEISFSSLIN